VQVSLQKAEALCQCDKSDGYEQVHEVPGESGHNLYIVAKTACVGVAGLLEQMVATPQHVQVKDTVGGAGMLHCQLHVVVHVEQVFNWNTVEKVGRPRRKLGGYERHILAGVSWHFTFFTTDGKSAVNQSQTCIN
jgi:hypothetical protein